MKAKNPKLRVETVSVDALRPYGNNAKIHTPEQIEQIKKSILEFGFNDPIAIDEDNMVIEGHGRLLAVKELGWKEVEAIRLHDLSDEQKRAYILVHNQLTLNTGFDLDMLQIELANITDLDMGEFGFEWESHETERKSGSPHFWGETELEDSEEYDEFCEKFVPKKTADDCYTPEPVYEVVKEWAVNRYNLSGKKIVRPFYPGGDYENENYDGAVVIDNPPFSIISEICGFYTQNGIDFFLFAPGLTLFSTYAGRAKYVTGTNITYENGAGILTGFVTNLGENKIEIAPELIEKIEEANKIETKQTKKKDYPKELITPAIYKLAKRGQALKIKPEEAYFVRKLENQSETTIYGGGFLVSERAAAERAAAERAAAELENIERFDLSKKEKEIVRGLSNE